MCVIVHQPAGKYLTKEDALDLWKTNPDGGGFAFIDDNREIRVEKHMEFDPFWRAFETARSAHRNRSFLIHMRIATHGAVNIDNVHPFQSDEWSVMAHNGIIHGVTPFMDEITDERSDTRYFVDEVLPGLPRGWQDNIYLRDMVEEWIGWSKLMFLTVDETLDHSVYRLGNWEQYKGMYLSNLYGLTKQKPKKKSKRLPAVNHSTPTRSTTPVTQDMGIEWYDWWMYKESELPRDGQGAVDYSKLDEWDLDFLLDAMRQERKTMGIEHGIYAFEDTGEFFCEGCEEAIDPDTAECSCYNLVCDNCFKFLAFCPRDMMCEDSAKWDYDNLTDTGKQYVQNGGKYRNAETANERAIIEKVLANPVPEGAGNISESFVGTTGWST